MGKIRNQKILKSTAAESNISYRVIYIPPPKKTRYRELANKVNTISKLCRNSNRMLFYVTWCWLVVFTSCMWNEYNIAFKHLKILVFLLYPKYIWNDLTVLKQMNWAKWVFRDSSGHFIENFEKYCSGISSFLPLSKLIWEDIILGGYKIGGILSWEKMQLLQNYCNNFCKILQENAISLTNSCKILQDMFESCNFFAKKHATLAKYFATIVFCLDESCSQCFCYRTKRIRYLSDICSITKYVQQA